MLAQGFDRILVGDPQLLATLRRTLAVAFGATGVALLVGLPLGVAIGQATPRGRRVALVFANAGLGLPPVVLGVFLALLLLPASPLGFLEWSGTIEGVFAAQVLLALPIVVALTAAAIAGLPDGLLHQARAYGAGWPARAVLALREARIGLLTAVIAALGSAVAEIGAVVIVGGNAAQQTNTLASSVLLNLSAGDPAGATANVIVLLAVILVLGGLLTAVQQGDGRRRRGAR